MVRLVKDTLANIHQDIKDTVSHFERIITTEWSHRKCEEQDSFDAILHEIVNTNRGAVAQSMCFRLFGIREEGEIQWEELGRDLSRHSIKEDYINGRCSTPIGGNISETRAESSESDCKSNKRKNDEDCDSLRLWGDRSREISVVSISSDDD